MGLAMSAVARRYFIWRSWPVPRSPSDTGPRRVIEEEREVTREQYESVNRSMVANSGPKDAQ